MEPAMRKSGETACKGCRETVRFSDGEIDVLIKNLHLRQNERVGEAEYRSRLTACTACPHLAYGTTCMQCGCLVRIRALRADSRCPDPSGGRWKKACGRPHTDRF